MRETWIWADATWLWYLNGRCHREDGPAVIRPDGTQYWYQNGKCHRLDGPAVIRPLGTQFWYLNGQSLKEEEWRKRTGK